MRGVIVWKEKAYRITISLFKIFCVNILHLKFLDNYTPIPQEAVDVTIIAPNIKPMIRPRII